ncbi:MAG: hypothetical protein WC344_00005 [Bacilli bacterium]|jgi:hypothetical protein
MIELKDAIISSKNGVKEKRTIAFDKGLNLIDYGQKYIFDFLSLQDQSLDEGQFIIDGKVFFPREDNDERIIVLLIKSAVFVITSCFVIAKSDNGRFKEIQSRLTALRDLPLTSDEEKRIKISMMLEVVSEHKPVYLSYDKNNDINQKHEAIIDKEIKKIAKLIVLLVLDKKPVEVVAKADTPEIVNQVEEASEDDFCLIDLSDGTIKQSEEKPLAIIKKNKALLSKVFRVNRISYLIALVSTLFSILFMAIAPHYLVEGDTFMGIFLIASCPLFVYISYMVTLSAFDFMDIPEKNTKVRRVITIIYAEVVAFVAALLAIGGFLLLGMNDFLFNYSTYQLTYAIGAFAIAIIQFVIPCFPGPLRKFNKALKDLVKRKSK